MCRRLTGIPPSRIGGPGEAYREGISLVELGDMFPDEAAVLAQVLPDVLDRIELWRVRRQRDEGNVGGDLQLVGGVPTGLIQKQKGVGADLDLGGDLLQVALHGRSVAAWLHEGGGRCRARDRWRRRCRPTWCAGHGPRGPGAAPGPASGELVLLPDPGFVLPLDLYLRAVEEAIADPRGQLGKFFLKSSMTPSSWA